MDSIKLTKKSIDQIESPAVDTVYWDTDLKGFGLKAYQSGGKTFILQTRLNGSSKRFTIGMCGRPWSPDQARDVALQMLADVAKEVDPLLRSRRAT